MHSFSTASSQHHHSITPLYCSPHCSLASSAITNHSITPYSSSHKSQHTTSPWHSLPLHSLNFCSHIKASQHNKCPLQNCIATALATTAAHHTDHNTTHTLSLPQSTPQQPYSAKYSIPHQHRMHCTATALISHCTALTQHSTAVLPYLLPHSNTVTAASNHAFTT